MTLSLLITSLLTLHGVLADVTSAVTAHGATLNLGGSSATTEQVAASTSTSLLNTAITTAPAGDLSTVTIDGSPGYQVAGNCVKECLFEEFENQPLGLIIPAELGCNSPYYNGCYCTQAVESSASSLISACIRQACSGTSLIAGALSIYDNYCASAGYPRNVIAVTTVTSHNAGNPGTTVVTGDVLYTLTLASTTITYTGPGLQTVTSAPTPTSPSSSSPNTSTSTSAPKTNIAAIVGGILGALILIILLAIFLVWLPRRQKAKERLQAQGGPVGGEGSTFVPIAAAAAVKRGGGRAELPDEGIGEGVVGEKEKVYVVSEVVSPVSPESGKVEMDGQGQGRYGLRPEELDSEGRYMGELHGDGRQFGGVELEGSGVLR